MHTSHCALMHTLTLTYTQSLMLTRHSVIHTLWSTILLHKSSSAFPYIDLIHSFFLRIHLSHAGNADLQVHDPHAIAGTTYTTIPWTNIPLASSQHHFLHYKYLPYNHTNTSLSPCLLSLSRCSQDVSAWVARSSSHKKNVHRMGEGSRVSALVPRGSLVHGALKFVRVVIFREISSLVMMLLWGNCVRHNAHVHLL